MFSLTPVERKQYVAGMLGIRTGPKDWTPEEERKIEDILHRAERQAIWSVRQDAQWMLEYHK